MAEDELKHRAAIRGLFDDIAKEFRWAVDDIRQEVVERPWFGRETTPEMVQSVDHLSEAEREQIGPKDHGDGGDKAIERGDLYGADAREIERDKEQNMER